MERQSFEFLNPRQIEVNVQKLDGSMEKLVCARLTNEMVKAIGEASKEVERKPDEATAKQIAVFFGGDWREYYAEYDNRVLQQVLRWMTEQLRNPT